MKASTHVSTTPAHATTDLVIAWALVVLGLARIAIAVLRRETAGVEVGLSTLVAALAVAEIVRITLRRHALKRS